MFEGQPFLLLGLVLGLQVKHFICDGPLQTKAMVDAKGRYGHKLGLLHAGIHMAGTLVVLWVFGMPPWFVTGFALADGVIHYHIDYTKETLVKAQHWTFSQPYFWWAYCADQGLHHITYLAIAAAAVALG